MQKTRLEEEEAEGRSSIHGFALSSHTSAPCSIRLDLHESRKHGFALVELMFRRAPVIRKPIMLRFPFLSLELIRKEGKKMLNEGEEEERNVCSPKIMRSLHSSSISEKSVKEK